MVESILLSTTQVSTFFGQQPLTQATGFFFERDGRLYLVTCRHVLRDEASGHLPDRIEIGLHADPHNLTHTARLSICLYRAGEAIWQQGRDEGGDVDIAVIALERAVMPPSVFLRCFTPSHLQGVLQDVEVGSPLLIVGFPLGFHDTLHHLPVVRQALIASAFGLRFDGRGYFLTDARTHHGSSGAPVVKRGNPADAALPWMLLGVHSARLEVGQRNLLQDEALGLNCTWYADILMTLTQPQDDAPLGVLPHRPS
jgi:hypothetical protein